MAFGGIYRIENAEPGALDVWTSCLPWWLRFYRLGQTGEVSRRDDWSSQASVGQVSDPLPHYPGRVTLGGAELVGPKVLNLAQLCPLHCGETSECPL